MSTSLKKKKESPRFLVILALLCNDPLWKKYLKRGGISSEASEYSMEIQCIVLAKPDSQELWSNQPGKCWVIFFLNSQSFGRSSVLGLSPSIPRCPSPAGCGAVWEPPLLLSLCHRTPEAGGNQELLFKPRAPQGWDLGDTAPRGPCAVPFPGLRLSPADGQGSQSHQSDPPSAATAGPAPRHRAERGPAAPQGPVPKGLTPSVLWV